MQRQDMKKIREELDGVKTVGIAGHVRPDGDCVGSCTAMMLYLKENFKQLEAVDVYLEEFPESFSIIKGTEQIKHSCGEDKVYDLFLTLDCADERRLGDAHKYLKSAKRSICYDHHVSNPGFADKNYILPDLSSTSEAIYHVMDDDQIPKNAAEALYMGIIHDTGVFQYACTSPETLEVAANLLRKGVNGSQITEVTFAEKTYMQNKILGKTLLESYLALDGTCIVGVVKNADMTAYGLKAVDLDGIVSQMRETAGVETAIFLHELKEGQYKISLRSKSKVDVSVICASFGGGGHVRAAGCTMEGDEQEIVSRLTAQISAQMKAEQ